jgi:hypothetical protein
MWIAGGLLFVLLATANGAGYRYGTSDQAFYIPVVARALDPAAFPRDGGLIDAQGGLILVDELIAAVARTTGAPLDLLFFAGYVLSLALVWTALVLIGRSAYGSIWLTVALAAAFTLRHRIPRTSANSFEPYFHPRMLAFALGALAIAAVLRRRFLVAVAVVGLAALVHLTTALWFAIAIGVAIVILDRRWRRLALPAGAAAAVLGAWLLLRAPISQPLAPMDDLWLQAVAGKDSLLATQWPLWAWGANLALIPILWWALRRRLKAGAGRKEDRALAWGATVLVVVFLAALPAVIARIALPVQLQLPRVFWVVDFIATMFVIGAIRRERTAVLVASLLVAVAAVRGVYVMAIEHPERQLFGLRLAASPWQDAMTWLNHQPTGAHVLADPGHAWRYGTSVRVAAERDVFVEEVKDSAIAIYSRDVAMRYLDRVTALGDFAQLNPHHARQLANAYDLDYLVTESDLALPLAYQNEQFRIYSLR